MPPTFSDMFHPWRQFRNLSHVKLRWATLPDGILGLTDFDRNEVILDPVQNRTSADRRCTITHEMHHLIRGPVPRHLTEREEREIDKQAARLLLPDIKRIGEALAWAHDLTEAAEELWVDEDTLKIRLQHLHPAERGYLRGRLHDPGHHSAQD